MKSRPTAARRPVVVVVRRKSVHKGRHLQGLRAVRAPDPAADGQQPFSQS